jgi:hypothetical protein
MSDKYYQRWLELERMVGEKANGVFAVPSVPCNYDIKAARKYCREKGIRIESFTPEDWENFRIVPMYKKEKALV